MSLSLAIASQPVALSSKALANDGMGKPTDLPNPSGVQSGAPSSIRQMCESEPVGTESDDDGESFDISQISDEDDQWDEDDHVSKPSPMPSASPADVLPSVPPVPQARDNPTTYRQRPHDWMISHPFYGRVASIRVCPQCRNGLEGWVDLSSPPSDKISDLQICRNCRLGHPANPTPPFYGYRDLQYKGENGEEFEEGDVVVLHDLTNESLNSRLYTFGSFHASKGRWEVIINDISGSTVLDSTKTITILVKTANLELS